MKSKTLSNPFTGEKGFWLYSKLFALSLIAIPFVLSNNLKGLTFGMIALTALGTFICAPQKRYGSSWMWIGLAFIFVCAAFNGTRPLDLFMFPLFILVLLAGLQINNDKGSKFFSFLIVFESIGALVMMLIQPHTGNGGFIDPINYNIATGLVLLTFMLSYKKWMWVTFPILLTGLYLASSEEAVIILTIFIVAILIRRDWSKRIIPTALAVALCVGLYLGPHLPEYFYKVSSNQVAMLEGKPLPFQTDLTDDPTRGRFEGWKLSLQDITLSGYGYKPTWTTADTVHDLFLRTLYDTGIIGLIGLLIILIGWSRKTAKYFVVLLIGMSLLDHFLWTQLNVWFWTLIGITYNAKEFYVFRR